MTSPGSDRRALVHEMVDKVNKPHSAKPRRRPRKAAGK